VGSKRDVSRLESRVGEGEFGQKHGHVVVEAAPGVRAQPVHQLVDGALQVGSAQRLDLLVHPEEPSRPVTSLEQRVGEEQQPVARPRPPARTGPLPGGPPPGWALPGRAPPPRAPRAQTVALP
jgi:hypothetical protein